MGPLIVNINRPRGQQFFSAIDRTGIEEYNSLVTETPGARSRHILLQSQFGPKGRRSLFTAAPQNVKVACEPYQLKLAFAFGRQFAAQISDGETKNCGPEPWRIPEVWVILEAFTQQGQVIGGKDHKTTTVVNLPSGDRKCRSMQPHEMLTMSRLSFAGGHRSVRVRRLDHYELIHTLHVLWIGTQNANGVIGVASRRGRCLSIFRHDDRLRSWFHRHILSRQILTDTTEAQH